MKKLNVSEIRSIAELEKPDLVPDLDELNRRHEDSINYYRFTCIPKTADEDQIYNLMEYNEFSPMQVGLYMSWSIMNMINDRAWNALSYHPMKEGVGSHLYIALNASKIIRAACKAGVLEPVTLSKDQQRKHLIDVLNEFDEIMNEHERNVCTTAKLSDLEV